MGLEKKGTVIVTPAIRVTDLPALPGDVTDSSRMGKWWDDFRQVLARLIQAKSESQGKEQVVVQTEVAAETPQPEAESKPVDWNDIANKPEKFPPLDHTHKTPWFQVEDPLCLSEVDPDTNLATLGFYEQKAATFLAGPLSGPVAKPVFRPLYTGDDANLDGSGAGSTPGDPGTYDDLNGGTGGGAPVGSVAVQARGGAWSLAGIPAWDGSPRRFGTNTWSGALVYSWTGCSTTTTYSGAGSYDPATGAAESTLTRHISQGGCISGTEYSYFAYNTPLWTYVSATNNVITATAIVCTAIASPGYGASGSGVARADLSDEDTPDSAIARMLATAEWGSATTAIRTIPTTGITGLYREARYRTEHTEGAGEEAITYTTLEGLEPWQRYLVTVYLESRPVDSAGAPTGDGSWTAVGTRTHYFIADLNGEGGIDWQTIEPTAGYETRIASTTIEAA